MEIITVVVTLVSAVIGLVIGYFAISLKMKSAKEAAEYKPAGYNRSKYDTYHSCRRI